MADIWGSTEEDSLSGTVGDDYIYGVWGGDTLYGGGGNDSLYGWHPDWSLWQSAEEQKADVNAIRGGDGHDYIELGYAGGSAYGGAGRDVIYADMRTYRYHIEPFSVTAYLNGGSGNDTFYAPRTADEGTFTYVGGKGYDTVDLGYVSSFDVVETNGSYRITYRSGGTTLTNIISGVEKIVIGASSPQTKTISLTGDERIDSLLSTLAWDATTITYGFPSSSSEYSYSGEPENGFAPFSAGQQSAVHAVLASVSQFTSVNFENPYDDRVVSSSTTLRYATANLSGDEAAHAYYPGNGSWAGDSWYSAESVSGSTRLGSNAYFIILHETGHALGLKHPHDITFKNQTLIPSEFNSVEYTVMSYNFSSRGDPQSLMMFDIAALQHMYGADYMVASSKTVYTWNPETGEMFLNGIGSGAPATNCIFRTVWDGGGVDTYDLSNYSTGVKVDLRPGEWCTFSEAQLASFGSRPAAGNVANALLFEGKTKSLIENAIGGTGADTLTGNNVSNRLTGRGGSDRLEGLGGSDVLIGGYGNDTYYVGAGDQTIEKNSSGYDRVFSRINWTMAENIEELRLFGTRDADGTGNGGSNALFGNAGDNVLSGMGGNDGIRGGAGADRMYGGEGDDHYHINDTRDRVFEQRDSGKDVVATVVSYQLPWHVEELRLLGNADIDATGNTQGNTVTGNRANNRLDGREGADQLFGGGGDDTLVGGLGRDTMSGGAGADTFRFSNEHAGDSRWKADVISDFAPIHGDKIDLSRIDAVPGSGTLNDPFEFIGNAGFSGVAGELRVFHINGFTLVEGDQDGDKLADLVIRVDGLHNLQADWLML